MNREPNNLIHYHPVSWRGRCGWLLWVVVIHAETTWWFIREHGPLASAGGDIWYFIGVARGHHRLFALDPLQWILPLFDGLPVAALFNLLLGASSALHLISILLLAGLLRETYRDERAALLSTAVYACLPSSISFVAGTFHHQAAGLPLLIGVIWLAIRWTRATERRSRWILGAGLFVVEALALSMGPDALVPLLAAIPCGIVWKLRNRGDPSSRVWVSGIAGGSAIFLFWMLSGPAWNWAAAGARTARGIDLIAQRSLGTIDLQPLEWSQFWQDSPWLTAAQVLLVGWGIQRGRWSELFLAATALLFATQALRFFYLFELGLTILFACALAQAWPRWPRLKAGLAGAAALLMASAAESWDAPCRYPSIIAQALAKVAADPRPNKLIWTTPNLGFLAREAGGAAVTTDWHHLDSSWMTLVTQPSREALEDLKRRGVTHFFLTSNDYSVTHASGGLERSLRRLTDGEFRQTLVHEAHTTLLAHVEGIELLDERRDPRTGFRLVLYAIR